MVVQGGLAGSSSIAARQERRACRAIEHYGPGVFLQAARVAVRGFESLKRWFARLIRPTMPVSHWIFKVRWEGEASGFLPTRSRLLPGEHA
jgi:hypothetical protein